MERHPLIGAEVLRRGEAQMNAVGHRVFGIEIAEAHHEKYGGSGYPRGLSGEAIPLSARIVATADVFDALTSKRPYKEAWPVERVLALLQEQAGAHFDPEVVAALQRAMPRIMAIYERHKISEGNLCTMTPRGGSELLAAHAALSLWPITLPAAPPARLVSRLSLPRRGAGTRLLRRKQRYRVAKKREGGNVVRMRQIFLLLLSLLLPGIACAEALVLLQGYLGYDDPWRSSGAAAAIAASGWEDQGHLFDGPAGVLRNGPPHKGARSFYTVELPTEAPLLVQERRLERYIDFVAARHPGETLYLAGFSAGGVLARLYMVQHPQVHIGALITIASPHLGTGSAEAGRLAGESPLGWFAPLLGADTLNRSQALYHDLSREQPGNLLFWLNRQPHPLSRYISVVRSEGGLLGIGDLIVPAWSQDLNNVVSLRGAAWTIPVGGDHLLGPADGALLGELLRHLHSS